MSSGVFVYFPPHLLLRFFCKINAMLLWTLPLENGFQAQFSHPGECFWSMKLVDSFLSVLSVLIYCPALLSSWYGFSVSFFYSSTKFKSLLCYYYQKKCFSPLLFLCKLRWNIYGYMFFGLFTRLTHRFPLFVDHDFLIFALGLHGFIVYFRRDHLYLQWNCFPLCVLHFWRKNRWKRKVIFGAGTS